MGTVDQRSGNRTGARRRRTRSMRPRAVVALSAIVLAALILAGCGGSSKPQISLKPATITGPIPNAGAKAVVHKVSAKLTAFEYKRLEAATARMRAAKSSVASGNLTAFTAACRSLGQRTKLLKEERQNCIDAARFLTSAISVGNCFKGVPPSSTGTVSPSSVAALYSCAREAAPVATTSGDLASNMRSLIALARKQGFTGKCFSFLAGSGSAPSVLAKLAEATSALVAAGKQQNLVAAVTATRTWAVLLKQAGQQIATGAKSVKVCRHT